MWKTLSRPPWKMPRYAKFWYSAWTPWTPWTGLPQGPHAHQISPRRAEAKLRRATKGPGSGGMFFEETLMIQWMKTIYIYIYIYTHSWYSCMGCNLCYFLLWKWTWRVKKKSPIPQEIWANIIENSFHGDFFDFRCVHINSWSTSWISATFPDFRPASWPHSPKGITHRCQAPARDASRQDCNRWNNREMWRTTLVPGHSRLVMEGPKKHPYLMKISQPECLLGIETLWHCLFGGPLLAFNLRFSLGPAVPILPKFLRNRDMTVVLLGFWGWNSTIGHGKAWECVHQPQKVFHTCNGSGECKGFLRVP